jgi:hypothetical protein
MLRTVVILIAALFFLSISILALPRMSVGDRVQHLKENLSLTDNQVKQVKIVLQATDSTIASMREN